MTPSDLVLLPAAAPLLILAPAIFLLLAVRDRARARQLIAAIGPRVSALARELHPGRRQVARAAFATATALAIVAVLQPLWGEGPEATTPRGADVVVCLDVSQSMLARDDAPSRLAAAQREVRALCAHARGNRIALVVFAGEARVVAPLTQDLESLSAVVESVDALSVSRGGTDLASALEAALGALEGAEGDHETVILLSDGEDLGQRGLRAAAQCKASGVTVHAVGFGSADGSKIPIPGPRGEQFLRDRAGHEVVTAADRKGLRQIAETTGGEFVTGSSAATSLTGLYDARILPMARKAFDDRERSARANRYQWPLLLAALLFLFHFALSERRSA